MEIIYLLIPISLLLVGLMAVLLYRAVRNGQFDDMEGPGHAILMDDDSVVNSAKLDLGQDSAVRQYVASDRDQSALKLGQ